MTDASGGVGLTPQPGGSAAPIAAEADAGAVDAAAPARRGLGLEIATWVVIALNLLALVMLGPVGIGVVELQASVSTFNGDAVDLQAVAVGYGIGLAVATVVLNGLAIVQRRSWGLGWALLAAVACWAVFLITVEMAGG